MKRDNIWAPWRMEYIKSEKEKGCVFCRILSEDDDENNLVVWRGKVSAVLMNRYPYNNGHLMVLPFRHVADPTFLTEEEALEIHRFVALAIKVLRELCSPDGFNIGANLGEAAGAGVAGHYHIHVVPRWSGDTNFMTVLGEVRVIPQHLKESYLRIREVWKKKVEENEMD